MLLPIISIVALRRTWTGFARSRDASAAVEFAFVAPIFFALVFAIMETGMVFFAGQVIETAVQDRGRAFYTKQAMTEDSLKQGLCDSVTTLMDCASTKLCLDIRKFAKGALIALPTVVNASGTYTCAIELPTSTDEDITVVVRAYYQWPLFVTGLGYNIGNIQGSNKRLLAATTAVRPQ